MSNAPQLTPELISDALPKLEQAARDGNVLAAATLAQWHLEGRLVPRDIPSARLYFERAAQLGSPDAALTAIGWLASGTGGRADWGEAMSQLMELAKTEPRAAAELRALGAMALDEKGDPSVKPESETLSNEPLVIRFSAFATPDECDQLIAMSAPHLRPAPVEQDNVAGTVHASVRTCDSMGFPLAGESPFIHAMNRRIAAALGIPHTHGEPTQVFRYQPGQEFKPHLDTGGPFAKNQRVWTFLVYLNDDYEGGETRFIKTGLAIKGRRGEAIMFRNVGADGRPDPMTEHWGMPIVSGTKWLLSRWIRERPLEF